MTQPATSTDDTATGTATYVFALCRDGDPAALAGLDGHAVGVPGLLRVGELDAVVQDVSAAAFADDALRERLSDRTELERCARAHHAVIAAAATRAPTLPLPLATLFLGDERTRSALGADEGRFRTALERIAGRVEWGVKVHGTPHAPVAPSTPSDLAPPSGSSPGRAYLDRLRGARRDREQRQEAGLHAAESVDRAMRDLAVASRRLRSHGAEITGERRVQLMNAAYLVAQGRDTEVTRAVERLRRSPDCRGVELEVTGPWVPYSFVDASTGANGAAGADESGGDGSGACDRG